MASPDVDALLDPDDPAPAAMLNPDGRSPFLLLGDHAGAAIPRRLGTLGLGVEDRTRHIALDIGVQTLGEYLADKLDATFLHQRHSRLVVDCNRHPDSPEAIPSISDGTRIPGNAALDRKARDARVTAIHRPYQALIARTIAERTARGHPNVLVSLHSFTPVLAGARRPWEIGVLHSEGAVTFAHALVAELRRQTPHVVGDNEPYRMDATDYTVPLHAFPAMLPYAELEVRQDLIADARGVEYWSAILHSALKAALGAISSSEELRSGSEIASNQKTRND